MCAVEKRYIFVVLIQNLVKSGFLAADRGVAVIEQFQKDGPNRASIEEALFKYDRHRNISLLVSSLRAIHL